VFTPDRRATPEWLDDPSSDAATAVISGEDIARCNTMLGGRWALVAQLRPLWAQLPRRLTLLDLASGVGDQAATLVTAGARHGVAVETIALDRRPELLRRAATRGAQPVAADSRPRVFARLHSTGRTSAGRRYGAQQLVRFRWHQRLRSPAARRLIPHSIAR
jgi:hypothetical protein